MPDSLSTGIDGKSMPVTSPAPDQTVSLANGRKLTAIRARGLWKRFGDRDVVKDVSFSVAGGEVLGLVGPNGAGKTTTIRMLLGVVQPDKGAVTLNGRSLSGETRERVGYLPEERGLYRGQRVIETLTYLGELRGMSRADATQSADQLLNRLGMTPSRATKVGELSRGMAQLIQFAACIIHDPTIVILDEPFAGLDPVHMRLLRVMIDEMRASGTTLVLSTHQMNQVEEMCDRVVMLNDGAVVIEGYLSEIKSRYQDDTLVIAARPWPSGITGVAEVHRRGDSRVLRLHPGTTANMVLQQFLDLGISVDRFEVETPSMEEIFLSVAGAADE